MVCAPAFGAVNRGLQRMPFSRKANPVNAWAIDRSSFEIGKGSFIGCAREMQKTVRVSQRGCMIALSFAKTRSPLVSTTRERGCNVVELDYMRPRRVILESDDILAKDNPGDLVRIEVLPVDAQREAALVHKATGLSDDFGLADWRDIVHLESRTANVAHESQRAT